jgi:hypothetical protein
MKCRAFTSKLRHATFYKYLIDSKQIDVLYLSYLAYFHYKLANRNVREFVWDDRRNGFAAVFDFGEVDTFSYYKRIDGWMALTKGAPPRSYQKQNLTDAFLLGVRSHMHRVRVENDFVGQGDE